MLPLELPDYTPRILVVGGSSMDRATPTTAATNNTYLLDLSQVSCNSGCLAVILLHLSSLSCMQAAVTQAAPMRIA